MEQTEKQLKETVFFVEANSNEKHNLWREFHEKVKWVQESGFTQIIGYIKEDKEMPVNVCFMFNVLDGRRICFYDVISRFSDAQMVENWITENYPIKWDNGTRRAITNSSNFHHVFHHIQDLNRKK